MGPDVIRQTYWFHVILVERNRAQAMKHQFGHESTVELKVQPGSMQMLPTASFNSAVSEILCRWVWPSSNCEAK
eukprot:556625-Pelagomonas_calceolata.AAC.7